MTGNATLLCFRDPGRQVRADDVKLRRFRAVHDAADVLFEPSCSLGCVGAHLLVTRHRGEIHVTGSSPPPPPLNVELARLYPRALDGPSPDRWPTPAEFNAPLGIPETASPMVERHRHAATLRSPEGPPTSAVPDDMARPGVRAPAPPLAPQGPNLGLPLVKSCTVPDCAEPAGQHGGICRVHEVAFAPGAPQCTFSGCLRPSAAQGLCSPHYQQRRRGTQLKPAKPPEPVDLSTVEQRFWSKVHKTEDCWLWTASKATGYGNFVFDGGHVYAHVLAWEWVYGPVPVGHRLAHRPDCPRHCVRPEHLQPKTPHQITAANIDRRNHPCPLHIGAAPPAPPPTSPETPATKPSPLHWKTRWPLNVAAR